MDFALKKEDSMMLKGIAICAMLVHHLFCSTSYDISQFSPLTLFLGRIGKVCVALFVFISGYGLAAGYEKLPQQKRVRDTIDIWIKAVLKRFVHFYLQYWPVFFIFVPLGVFVFDIPLLSRYGESRNALKMLFGDIWGYNEYYSYNITWWFNKLILVLYLLSPFLFVGIENKWTCWPILIALLFLSFNPQIVHVKCDGLTLYAASFGAGMFWSCQNDKINTYFSKSPRWLVFLFSVIGIASFCFFREKGYFGLGGARADLFLTLSIAVFTISLRQYEIVKKILTFLGKHSANIYLTHTFILFYWFMPLIYCCSYAPIVFIILIITCIAISLGIEWIKEKIGVYKLQRFLDYYLN